MENPHEITLQETSRVFGVDECEITQKNAFKIVSKAKNCYCYIMREIFGLSQKMISDNLKYKGHSTTIYQLKQARKRIKNDPMFRSQLLEVESNIKIIFNLK